MPRTGVSQNEVAEAIHMLETAGLTPSIRLIRQKIGRGSLSTIAGHKRAFDADRHSQPGPPLPDPIARALHGGASQLWQELTDAAEAIVEDHQRASDQRLAVAQQEKDDAVSELARLRVRFDDLRKDHDELERRQAASSETIAEQKALIVAAQSARDELDRSSSLLANDCAQLRDELAKARTVAEARGVEKARLAERLEARDAELSDAKDRLQDQVAEHRTLAESNTALQASLEQSRAILGDAQRDAAASQAEAQKGIEQIAQSNTLNAKLSADLAALTQEKDALIASHAAQIEERDSRLKDLKMALNDAQVVNRLLVRQSMTRNGDAESAGVSNSQGGSSP